MHLLYEDRINDTRRRTLTKVGLSMIPALASNTEEHDSWLRGYYFYK